MARFLPLTVLFAVLALGFLSEASASAAHPVVELARKMQTRVDFAGIDDPKATLRDVLDQLRESYRLTFDINDAAFRAEMSDVASMNIAARPIPKMSQVSLGTVLKKILDRVEHSSGTTYILRPDRIEITTNEFRTREFYRRGVEEQPEELGARVLLPLAQVDCNKQPLEDVLRELAKQTDANIILDARPETGKTPVTATLINVPLDTAVRVLADMADLKPVVLDNVLYVTNKENAETLQAEQAPKLVPGGFGPGMASLARYGSRGALMVARR